LTTSPSLLYRIKTPPVVIRCGLIN
jgi:hypothetical protein